MKQQQFRSPYFRLTISCTLLLLASLPAWTLEPAPSAAKSSYFHHASVGYLGVDFEDLTNSQRVDFHLQGKQGVAIAAVDHDAPAGQAGLKAQDVVLRMNGYLAQNAAQLRAMLPQVARGEHGNADSFARWTHAGKKRAARRSRCGRETSLVAALHRTRSSTGSRAAANSRDYAGSN